MKKGRPRAPFWCLMGKGLFFQLFFDGLPHLGRDLRILEAGLPLGAPLVLLLQEVAVEHAQAVTHRGGSAVSRDEHTTNFAWNVGAGVAYNVNDALYIDAAYRYVDLGYTEASGSLNGDQIKVGSRPYNHEFMLGLRFAF